jgi:hypothetical protein
MEEATCEEEAQGDITTNNNAVKNTGWHASTSRYFKPAVMSAVSEAGCHVAV